MNEEKRDELKESPDYVRTSLAAAMTLGICSGKFFRGAKLYCINLLLTYREGCVGRCAYCGLSRSRKSEKLWAEGSFIRVEWPTVMLNEVIARIRRGVCPHVERVCVSMITNRRAPNDLLTVIDRFRQTGTSISALITPTIINKEWLVKLKMTGADKVGVAIDAATSKIFEDLRGRRVGGPHTWEKYWKTVKESVEVFGPYNVGIHLITGLGETEEEMINVIQLARDMRARVHLFSFFPEEGSPMQNCLQPSIGTYKRMQLATYLIHTGVTSANEMEFDGHRRVIDYGITPQKLDTIIDSGLPFMTSGCSGKTMDNACNRPFANCTPHQAYRGKFRNFPFQPNEEDIKIIRKQLCDFSDEPKTRNRL